MISRNTSSMAAGLFLAVWLLFAAGCQTGTTEPAPPDTQTAATAPAGPSVQEQQLQQEIQQQQDKISQLQKQLQDKEEQDRIQAELQRQQQELDKLKADLRKEKQKQKEASARATPPADQTTTPTADTTATTPAEPTPTPPPAPADERVTSAQPPPDPARTPQKVKEIVVDKGANLVVLLRDPLSTKTSKAGDTFETTLEKGIEVDGETIIPSGAKVYGKILNCNPSGKVKGKAEMSFHLVEVVIGGDSHPIETNLLQFVAEGSQGKDAAIIGGGAGVGAIIGGLVGGKKGAAIGAVIGGGGGTAVVLKTAGKEVEFPPETRFQFVLDQALVLRR